MANYENYDNPQYSGMPRHMYHHSAKEIEFKGEVKNMDRESRNKIEKDRRTKLNNFIEELAVLIPLVSDSTRKITKTGILRLAAHDLRKEHVFGNSSRHCHLDPSIEMVNTFLNLMGGFIITMTRKGIILTVSSNIQHYLGHCQIDLLGQNIFNITHPHDYHILEQNIRGPDDSDCDVLPDERKDFCVRLMKAGTRTESRQYETCRIDGALRKADNANSNADDHLIRRQRVRRDRPITSSGNDLVFIGLARIVKRPAIPSTLIKISYQEYWTRHLIDGRIVQCDQTISMVAGYMADEILGVSAFTFMHKEDVRWAIIALRQMYDQNQEFGESCYRLMSRTGQFIFLKTRGFLEIDRKTKAVQSFVCVNTLVQPQDGRAMIENMKRKYSAMVNISDENQQRDTADMDAENLEDPTQLEQVIMHLVTNLPIRYVDAAAAKAPEPLPEPAPSAAPPESLNIIPPDPCAIRSAIAKSVSVLGYASGKKFYKDEPAKALKRPKDELSNDEEGEVCKQMRLGYH